ncbi:ATP-binding cassette domain-containing protein [Parafilimonas sp.]|uniref:ATP-binding cassette domain-containing protein n=1 Tax=Parafilimonas sp. TaxID=1969739 RepID=UPI0039E29221
MQLQLQSIIPTPLKDKLLQRHSDVWNKQLQLNNAEYIKIKAPSGTGKTTLVHILYKLRRDYEGNVLLDDKNLATFNADDLALLRQQNISIIFQDLRLFPNITASENIELNRVLQQPLYESHVIDEMAAQLGIAHILHQKAVMCSYGEQQRIAIIRALMQPFNWLIMDEPFSHLDKNNIDKASALIDAECKKRNAGFILTDLEDDDHFNYTRLLNL